jgi:hypothetical protein
LIPDVQSVSLHTLQQGFSLRLVVPKAVAGVESGKFSKMARSVTRQVLDTEIVQELFGTRPKLGRWTMATQVGRTGGMSLGRDRRSELAKEKQRGYEDKGLCLALFVLVGWALFVGLRGVNWTAVDHAAQAVVALFH